MKNTLAASISGFLTLAGAAASMAQPLVLDFSFDDSVTEQVTGEGPSIHKSSPGLAGRPVLTTGGQGLSRSGTGEALNLNIDGYAMGSPGALLRYGSPDVDQTEIDDKLSGLRSYTWMVWYKPASDLTEVEDRAFLFNVVAPKGKGNQMGAAFLQSRGGGLELGIAHAGRFYQLPAGDNLIRADRWSVIACTYDGTGDTGVLTVYAGGLDTALAEVGSFDDLPPGPLPNASRWCLGSNGDNAKNSVFGFAGLIDEIRVFGSHADASGALDAAALNVARREVADAAAGSQDEPN